MRRLNSNVMVSRPYLPVTETNTREKLTCHNERLSQDLEPSSNISSTRKSFSISGNPSF